MYLVTSAWLELAYMFFVPNLWPIMVLCTRLLLNESFVTWNIQVHGTFVTLQWWSWTIFNWAKDRKFHKSLTFKYIFLLGWDQGVVNLTKLTTKKIWCLIYRVQVSICWLCYKEEMWLCHLFKDILFPQSKALSLHCDNYFSIVLILYPCFHDHTRNILKFDVTIFNKRWKARISTWHFQSLNMTYVVMQLHK